MLEQAEGGVREVAAAYHFNEDHKRRNSSLKEDLLLKPQQHTILVRTQAPQQHTIWVAAAQNWGEDAIAAAAYNPGADANAAATEEKAKKTGDVLRSPNSQNEKINGEDHEP